MKKIVLASLMMVCLPLWAMAQSAGDDLYFIPKKKTEKKEEVKKQETKTVTTVQTGTTTVQTVSAPPVVIKDVKGRVRDVDEYNRRYTSRENRFSMENDTLYIEEKPLNERGEWVNGFEGSQDDYEYAMRIIRFRNPRYAIPVSSPLYWDVVYGAYPSWDWNVYDDGMYAYIFPTYTNRLWWDWRWNYPYGSSWTYWGWHSPWYYDSWYGFGWWSGYWGGYWAWNHHHYYHHYAWGGGHWGGGHGWRPSYRNDISSSRINGVRDNRWAGTQRRSGISAGRTVGRGNASSSIRPATASGRSDRTGYVRSSSTIGRVVNSTSNANAVRPNTSSSVDNSGRIMTRTQSIRSAAGYTRPSRSAEGGSTGYTRPNNYGKSSSSTYSRPSSTRSTYQGTNTRSRATNSYNRSTTTSSRSSFSTGSSSSSRSSYSSGGGSSRSSGGGAGGGRRR